MVIYELSEHMFLATCVKGDKNIWSIMGWEIKCLAEG